jgi:hypothetical protein
MRVKSYVMKKHVLNKLRTPSAPLRIAGGIGLLSIVGLATPSVSAFPLLADVSLNIGIGVDAPPPPPRQEVIVGVAPGPDYIWVAGYWGGSPGHYEWVSGHWDRPPHPHGVWSQPHWDKDRDGHYHLTRGEWRDR